MVIGVGLLVLCVIFIVFGSKTEEASILYYDMEGSEGEWMETEDTAEETSSVDDTPADAPAEEDAASIASSIYNDITL